MLNTDEMTILINAVNTFGERNQEDVAIEEMSELIKALIKHRRYNTPETKENILEEIADVVIMICQLTVIHGFDSGIVDKKIYRLKQRLDETNKPPTTNFDRIKNMSLDEMADMLFHDVETCDFCIRKGSVMCIDTNCKAYIKKYLESEVKPDE